MAHRNGTTAKVCACGTQFYGSAHVSSTPLCKPSRRVRDNANRRRVRSLARRGTDRSKFCHAHGQYGNCTECKALAGGEGALRSTATDTPSQQTET